MKTTIFFVFIFISTRLFGQVYPLTKFFKTEYHAKNKDSIAIRSNDFRVDIVDGKLQVSRNTYKFNEGAFPSGKLLPLYVGEWGSWVYYKPYDTLQKNFYINGRPDTIRVNPISAFILKFFNNKNEIIDRYKGSVRIFGGAATSIFKYKDSLYLVDGAIYSINLRSNIFIIKPVFISPHYNNLFDDVKLAVPLNNNEIVVATENNIYVVDSLWKGKLIFENLDWNILSINSMAILDEHHIYIGMRGGYAEIDLPNKLLMFNTCKQD